MRNKGIEKMCGNPRDAALRVTFSKEDKKNNLYTGMV